MTWFTADKTTNVSWIGVGWNRFGEHGPPTAIATDIVNNAVLSEGGKEVLIVFIDRFPI
jgi:hypothetical protein